MSTNPKRTTTRRSRLNHHRPEPQFAVRELTPNSIAQLHKISADVVDPFEADRASDHIRVMTERQLNRLLFLVAEIATELAQGGGAKGAVSWLYSHLPVYDGAQPVHACLEREAFLRAMLWHARESPTEAQAARMGELISRGVETSCEGSRCTSVRSCGTLASLADLGLGQAALYTATVVDDAGDAIDHIFVALLAVDEQDARQQIRQRLGSRLSNCAEISKGFDPSEPVAASLISDAIADSLAHVAKDPRSPLAAGLNLFVEYRFEI